MPQSPFNNRKWLSSSTTSMMNTTICYAARYLEKSVQIYKWQILENTFSCSTRKLFKRNDYNDVLKQGFFVKMIISRSSSFLNMINSILV